MDKPILQERIIPDAMRKFNEMHKAGDLVEARYFTGWATFTLQSTHSYCMVYHMYILQA